MRRKLLYRDLALTILLILGVVGYGLCAGGCVALDNGPAPDDMIDLGGGSAARGCILRRPDPEGRTCRGIDDTGDTYECAAVDFEGELGCCRSGATDEGEPALYWAGCDEVVP